MEYLILVLYILFFAFLIWRHWYGKYRVYSFGKSVEKESVIVDPKSESDITVVSYPPEVNDKKVAQVFIDSVSVSRGNEPPSLNQTTTATFYTDGTVDIKKESN